MATTASIVDNDKVLRDLTILQAQLGTQAAKGYLYLVGQRRRDLSTSTPTPDPAELNRIMAAEPPSNKVQQLAHFLDMNMTAQSSAIVFVERRVVAVMLCHLLRNLTLTSRLAAASFVGTAGGARYRTDASNVVADVDQRHTLEHFRAGHVRVLICTSVAEEGLDIRSCNLVIRFDLPQNLKAYIQSRGRARMQASQFVMMVDGDDPGSKIQVWRNAEQDMIRLMTTQQLRYEDLRRIEHDTSAEVGLSYCVEGTG